MSKLPVQDCTGNEDVGMMVYTSTRQQNIKYYDKFASAEEEIIKLTNSI